MFICLCMPTAKNLFDEFNIYCKLVLRLLDQIYDKILADLLLVETFLTVERLGSKNIGANRCVAVIGYSEVGLYIESSNHATIHSIVIVCRRAQGKLLSNQTSPI